MIRFSNKTLNSSIELMSNTLKHIRSIINSSVYSSENKQAKEAEIIETINQFRDTIDAIMNNYGM